MIGKQAFLSLAVCTQEAELLRPDSEAAAERDPPAQPLHRPRDSRARRHAPLRRQEPRLIGVNDNTGWAAPSDR